MEAERSVRIARITWLPQRMKSTVATATQMSGIMDSWRKVRHQSARVIEDGPPTKRNPLAEGPISKYEPTYRYGRPWKA